MWKFENNRIYQRTRSEANRFLIKPSVKKLNDCRSFSFLVPTCLNRYIASVNEELL